MEYPILHSGIWGAWGGGLLIALVATIHVFISHFAVGGGLFIAVLETRSQREGGGVLKDYLLRYARFFLIFTLVYGGLTGVGIWFAISITAPGATSTLIHAFVLGWATEWAFFLAEIVCLLAYMRSFEASRSTRRLMLAWLYFAFAWGSLAVVQGFISFMLTPGEWLTTHRFWDGFFNPTYFPGLLFRTAIAAVLAGVFAMVTASGVTDGLERVRLTRFAAWWAVLPLPLTVLAGWLHIQALSPEQQALALGGSPEVAAAMRVFWWVVPIVLAGGIVLAAGLPRRAAKVTAVAVLAASFLFIGSFEMMRESARRPYVITGFLYSNGIPVSQAATVNQRGILASARWARITALTPENRLQAGGEIFTLECLSCHSLGGPMLDILPLSRKFSTFGMEAFLSGLGAVGRYMPPFLGAPAERQALALYLTEGLHGVMPANPVDITAQDSPVPPFNPESSPYLLTAVADFGLNMLAKADGDWTVGIGTQGLTAQLIKRGPDPERVTKDVTLRYAVENGPSGTLEPDAAGQAFRATDIALSPYPASGGFAPYPLATLTATDAGGTVLAQTQVVLAVSTELGCRNCHGGEWSHGVAGISKSTGRDILQAHDRLSRTSLTRQSAPVDCRSCHDDAASGGKRALNLSAAIHGLHAVYLAGQGDKACNACHPTDPTGATRAFRDPHQAAGLDCTNCHGVLEDHALSLLTREAAEGVAAAKPRMAVIPVTKSAPEAAARTQRIPWVNEPDCLACHANYGSPETMQAYGHWNKDAASLYRARRDDLDAMACASCHGAPHAYYPSANPYGSNRDNLQPLQYQGLAKPIGSSGNCKACHTVDMDMPAHHPDMGLK